MKIHFQIAYSLALSICGLLSAVAQTNACGTNGGQNANNNWRRSAAREGPDNVSPNLRAARDVYWSRLLPPYTRNDDVPGMPVGGAAIDPDFKMSPELEALYAKSPYKLASKSPPRSWIEGKFLRSDVHETSTKAIYTEIHFLVIRSIGEINAATPANGSVIDLGTMGGCLLTESREIHNFATFDQIMRPGRKYLLQISHQSAGDFYEFEHPVADLTTGFAQPVSAEQVQLAKKGRWPYSNLSEERAAALLDHELSQRAK